MNFSVQMYKGIPIKLIDRKDYPYRKAKRYTLNGTNQNVWIPNKHLAADGTLKDGEDVDYVFRRASVKLTYAGITQAVQGIKRRTK